MGIISNGNTIIDNGAIESNEVDTTQIVNDAVTADKLADTAVVAGPYSTANITVDAQGRITSASSGSAGDGSYYPRALAGGPSSGSFTTPANASKYYAFAQAGGGGGGGGSPDAAGGAGGNGGFGLWSGNITASTPYSYSVGGPGNAGVGFVGQPGTPGGNGGATNVTGLFTANGGNGGTGGPQGPNAAGAPGNNGTQPGSNSSLPTGNWLAGGNVSLKGNGGSVPGGGPQGPGNAGGPGSLTVYDNGGQ